TYTYEYAVTTDRSFSPTRMWLLFLIATPPSSDTYTRSLHDALPISQRLPPFVSLRSRRQATRADYPGGMGSHFAFTPGNLPELLDRKSTRLNSSHGSNSYAVFCLNKKCILTLLKKREIRPRRSKRSR